MTKYSRGKIYKIVCYAKGLVYYGSTIQTLKRRLSKHKSNYKCGENCSSKLVLENNDFEIILIENYQCDSKQELLDREGFYIRNNVCINKQIAGRTIKEYNNDNYEKIKEYSKQYRINNKEKMKEYRIDNKQKSKQYRIDNNQKNKQYQKQYQIFKQSWGGDYRYNNNLLNISTDLFTI